MSLFSILKYSQTKLNFFRDVANPADYFKSNSYPGYEEEKKRLEEMVARIPKEPNRGLEPFYWDGEEVIDSNLAFMKYN